MATAAGMSSTASKKRMEPPVNEKSQLMTAIDYSEFKAEANITPAPVWTLSIGRICKDCR
jgi:hypothetical protein